MQDRPNSRWGSWVAIAAAYLTAFQLVFGGLAPASATGFDPTRILCAQPAPGDPAHPGPSPAHHPDCCLFGCCCLGHLLALAPVSMPAERLEPGMLSVIIRPAFVGLAEPGYAPRQTRGPPPAV